MGVLLEELGKRRWGGGGLMLLVLLCVLLLTPLLRHRGIDHPLRGSHWLALCPLLPAAPMPFTDAERKGPQPGLGGSYCVLMTEASPQRYLRVDLVSTRDASDDGAQRTSTLFETWMKEAKASGATDILDQTGDWSLSRSYRLGVHRQLLIDDRGVLLVFQSDQLDVEALKAYAQTVSLRLRQPR